MFSTQHRHQHQQVVAKLDRKSFFKANKLKHFVPYVGATLDYFFFKNYKKKMILNETEEKFLLLRNEKGSFVLDRQHEHFLLLHDKTESEFILS